MKSSTPLREITAQARFGLSGSWGKSIGVMLVYILVAMSLSFIPVVGSIVQLFVAAPLVVGLYIYFLATVYSQENPFGMLFEGFGRFWTAFFANFLVGLFVLAWSLPLILLSVAGAVVAIPMLSTTLSPEIGAVLVYVAMIPLFIFMMFIQLRYTFVLLVVADDPAVRARDAVRRSVSLMKGNYVRLILFSFRFIGWIILSLFTFGIGMLWLYPYLIASYTAFYLDLKEKP